MLALKDINKIYQTGDFKQKALDQININFRQNEFVSILGPSGSGKTTLLNIIGGLDRYTSGDLLIDGRSTRDFKDRDWDAYRNNAVGFVFQSYNLIDHQTVLANVELALALAGISREERREKAKTVLGQVGLFDHIHKKPAELSGGQMQRVAIARALVNDPNILLADEPTGALDSDTSVQIMDLLKEIAEDRLVIMVTHNPELAKNYSTRIVELLDGQVIADSNPYDLDGDEDNQDLKSKLKQAKMAFTTALALSFNNLQTKKGRTLLTAFAGSIGIIGIGLVLSLSHGIQNYVDTVQEDFLKTAPIQISEDNNTFLHQIMAFQEAYDPAKAEETEEGQIYSANDLDALMGVQGSENAHQNDLTSFLTALEAEYFRTQESQDPSDLSNALTNYQLEYNMPMNTYVQENPDIDGAKPGYRLTDFDSVINLQVDGAPSMSTDYSDFNFSELMTAPDSDEIAPEILDQYELVQGEWPDQANELVFVLRPDQMISDITMYSLGQLSHETATDYFVSAQNDETVDRNETPPLTYDELMSIDFKLLLNQDYFIKNEDGTWRDIRQDEDQLALAIENGYDLSFSGIVTLKMDEDGQYPDRGLIPTNIAYTKELTDLMLKETQNSTIIAEQKQNPDTDIISGLAFDLSDQTDLTEGEKAEQIKEYFANRTDQEKAQLYGQIMALPSQEEQEEILSNVHSNYPSREDKIEVISQILSLSNDQAEILVQSYNDDELEEFLNNLILEMIKNQANFQAQVALQDLKRAAGIDDPYDAEGDQLIADIFDDEILAEENVEILSFWYDEFYPDQESPSNYTENLKRMGAVDPSMPSTINLYTDTFAGKDVIDQFIQDYNEGKSEANQIEYTDTFGLIMSSVTSIIDIVTIGLIFFISISLIVSSIMIGIITYISVLERTKEIGILRSIGASKRDISRVFNAETLLIGFLSGLVGIGITLILNQVINIIVENWVDISSIARLPFIGGIALIFLSTLLTLIAGLIPSRKAANQDPIEALRS